MGPTEYRETIARLGLSQVQAASFLGVDERTSRRWASGDREIPLSAARFLSFLDLANIKPKRVLRVLEEGGAL